MYVTTVCIVLIYSSCSFLLLLFFSSTGSSSPIDICSLFNTGQLLLFSAGALAYGVQAEATMFSHDFTWLGQRRIDIAQIRAVLSKRYATSIFSITLYIFSILFSIAFCLHTCVHACMNVLVVGRGFFSV